MNQHASNQQAPEQRGQLEKLLQDLTDLEQQLRQGAQTRLNGYAARFPDGIPEDVQNLADYLAFRSHDLRNLQLRLQQLGLSSLGRSEANIRNSLQRIRALLARALGHRGPDFPLVTGRDKLDSNTDALLGPRNHDRYARIMVTLPSAAACEPALVKRLVEAGMDCARINCAHDTPDEWRHMVEHIRQAERETGHRCRIMMDLAGHKIRTGPIESGPAVVHLRYQRDALGHPTGPIHVLLTSQQLPAGSGDLPAIPIPQELASRLAPDSRLHFHDTRDKHRILAVQRQIDADTWLCECNGPAYITPDTLLELKPARDSKHTAGRMYLVGPFPGRPLDIRVQRGERLLLRYDQRAGRPRRMLHDQEISPAQINCSHPEIVRLLSPDQAVWIDDGKIGCMVETLTDEGALLRITHCGPRGSRIRSDKGINLPDTELPLPPLTEKDLADLPVVVQHADLVGLSFVRRLQDVDTLRQQLARLGKPQLPIIAKIETRAAVANLPDILLGTLGQHPLGIMIARGDLAVELGSVRMAEIQEEILWLCEAAHIPVVWATQVLETLAKKGTVSRPEITDAAMSVRAECVMLNKGEFIADAIEVLDHILVKMDAHQYKKVSRLRKLHW